MYYRDYTWTMTAASTLVESATLTLTTGDSTVEGNDWFKFEFTTTSSADLIII